MTKLDFEALQKRTLERLRELMAKNQKSTSPIGIVEKALAQKTADCAIAAKWVCPKCESDAIISLAWVNANTREWYDDCKIESGFGYKCTKGCGMFKAPKLLKVA